eukprot:GDKJ01049438.1.p1 GENE.GDKJ01049438.1~~GDKJ01049438.1.p1  ORF type:complete len:1190 (-),score=402.20 GDKJ01049438.1:76-3645(-)
MSDPPENSNNSAEIKPFVKSWADYTDSSDSEVELKSHMKFKLWPIRAIENSSSESDESDSDDECPPDLQLPETWSFWLDLGQNRACINAEDYVSSLMSIGSFATVKTLWQFLNNIKISSLPKAANLYVFKEGIRPLWEDPKNALGGRWVLSSFAREHTTRLFERFVLAICGACLDFGATTNGVALSVRAKGNSVALWTASIPSTVAPLNKPESAVQKSMRNIRDIVAGCEGGGTLSVEFKTHAGAILSHDSRVRMSVAHAHAAAHAVSLAACTMGHALTPTPITVGLVPLPASQRRPPHAPPPSSLDSSSYYSGTYDSSSVVTQSFHQAQTLGAGGKQQQQNAYGLSTPKPQNSFSSLITPSQSNFSINATPFTPSFLFNKNQSTGNNFDSKEELSTQKLLPSTNNHSLFLLSSPPPAPLANFPPSASSSSHFAQSSSSTLPSLSVKASKGLSDLVESDSEDEQISNNNVSSNVKSSPKHKTIREMLSEHQNSSSSKNQKSLPSSFPQPSPSLVPLARQTFAQPSPLLKQALSPLMTKLGTPLLSAGVPPPRTFAELKRESPLIKSASTPILTSKVLPADFSLSSPKSKQEAPLPPSTGKGRVSLSSLSVQSVNTPSAPRQSTIDVSSPATAFTPSQPLTNRELRLQRAAGVAFSNTDKVLQEQSASNNLQFNSADRSTTRHNRGVDSSSKKEVSDENSSYLQKRLARFAAMESSSKHTPLKPSSSSSSRPIPHTGIPKQKMHSMMGGAKPGQSSSNMSQPPLFGASAACGWIVSSPALRSLGEIATWSESVLIEDLEEAFELDGNTSTSIEELVDANSGFVSAATLSRIINPQLHMTLENEFNANNVNIPIGANAGSSLPQQSHANNLGLISQALNGRRSSLFGSAGRLSALLDTPAASVFNVNAAPFVPSFLGRLGGAADGGVKIAISELDPDNESSIISFDEDEMEEGEEEDWDEENSVVHDGDMIMQQMLRMGQKKQQYNYEDEDDDDAHHDENSDEGFDLTNQDSQDEVAPSAYNSDYDECVQENDEEALRSGRESEDEHINNIVQQTSTGIRYSTNTSESIIPNEQSTNKISKTHLNQTGLKTVLQRDSNASSTSSLDQQSGLRTSSSSVIFPIPPSLPNGISNSSLNGGTGGSQTGRTSSLGLLGVGGLLGMYAQSIHQQQQQQQNTGQIQPQQGNLYSEQK